TIEFFASGTGQEGTANESWGVDNLAVILHGLPGDPVKIYGTNFDSTPPSGSVAVGTRFGPEANSVNRTYSVQVGSIVPIGNPLLEPSLDLASGSLFVGKELVGGGRLDSWSLFAGAVSDQRSLTPIIFRKDSATTYTITGIGRTRVIIPGQQ